jgi:glycosyltransferase involved in cell wall biosynthesis
MSETPKLPPVRNEPISLVLTARNDAAHLEGIVAAWAAELDSLGSEYEILLVDDGSTDETPRLAGGLTSRFPRLRLLGHTAPRGSGAALRTALPAVRHPLLLTAPADPQYEPTSLKALLERIDDAHLVVGHRVWQPVPLPLRVLGFGARVFLRVLFDLPSDPTPGWLGARGEGWWFVGRLLFGLRIRDQDCGLRLHRRHVFDRIPIQAKGEFHRTEVLAKANFLGFVMMEAPVPYHPRRGPSPDAPEQLRRDLKRVFFSPDFGPYPLPALLC